jgi:hypothetical protein
MRARLLRGRTLEVLGTVEDARLRWHPVQILLPLAEKLQEERPDLGALEWPNRALWVGRGRTVRQEHPIFIPRSMR